MRKILKELGSHSLTYLIGNVAISASSIVLLPLYTRYLSKSDYGAIEILDSLSSILLIIFMSGLGPAYGKFHYEATSEDEQKKVFGTTFWFVFLLSTAGTLGLAVFRAPLAKIFLGDSSMSNLMFVGLVTMWINPIYLLGTYYLNVRKMPGAFLVFSMSKFALNIAFNLLFIVKLDYGAMGMFIGDLLSSFFIGIWLYWTILAKHSLPIDVRFLKKAIVFAFPLVPSLLCAALMHRADRYLLKQYADLAVVGIYGIGYKFPFMLASLLLQSFGRIWGSSAQYEIAQQKNWKEIYSRVTTYFFSIIVVCEVSLGVVSHTVLRVLTTPEYYAASGIIQILAAGVCIYSLHNFFSVAATVKNKTWYLPISYSLAAITSIGLNYLLLPHFGYIAAAWVTVAAYTVFSVSIYLTLNRFYPVPYEFGRMGLLFALGIAIMLLNMKIQFESLHWEIGKEMAFLTVLPAFILFGPFLKKDEAEEFAALMGKFLPWVANAYRKFRKLPPPGSN